MCPWTEPRLAYPLRQRQGRGFCVDFCYARTWPSGLCRKNVKGRVTGRRLCCTGRGTGSRRRRSRGRWRRFGGEGEVGGVRGGLPAEFMSPLRGFFLISFQVEACASSYIISPPLGAE